MNFEKYLAKEWMKIETWEQAHRLVAEIIAVNEFLEKRRNFYKEQLSIRSAELVEAIRMLQEEGVDFDAEMAFGDAGKRVEEVRNRFNVETDLRINAELEQEVKAKAHASGELAELLSDELNQKENDYER
tara:strand:+ start:219 stop:608 length:390 start_codon:yes stop_codon:yes gene_type:complete